MCASESHYLYISHCRMALQYRTRNHWLHCFQFTILLWGRQDTEETEMRHIPHPASLCPWFHFPSWLAACSRWPDHYIYSQYWCDLQWFALEIKAGESGLYLKSRPCCTLNGEWLGSQQNWVCLACPVRHEHPLGPAQHGQCACHLPAWFGKIIS